MAHPHSHSPAQAPDSSNARRLRWAFIVTAGFMLVEAVGGAISGSLALLADAGHMLTDSAALLFALLAVRFASRPPNTRHTFGWFAFDHPRGVSQCHCPGGDYHFDCLGGHSALPASAAGGWRDDDGDCGRRPAGQRAGLLDPASGSEEQNLNVRCGANVLGDLLGSVGAIVAAVVILTTGWTPVDPILSVLVSCLVLRSAWRLLKESLNELLEGAPRSLDVAALQRDIRRSIPEVRDVHHVHVWLVGKNR